MHANTSMQAARDVKHREPHPALAHEPVRVAICVVGAWRIWNVAWPRMHRNVVAPLKADVFVVTDMAPLGAKGERRATFMDLTAINRSISSLGAVMRDGRVNSAADMADISPVVAESMAVFPLSGYFRKIWQCGQLIHRSGRSYDVILRTRPDMLFGAPWAISRNASKPSRFRLQVGRTDVDFGGREVVIPSLSPWCGNDWLALGPTAAMTVTMDLARFVGPRVAWFSPVSNVRAYIDLITISVASALSPCGGCGEAMHDMLWRRTGTRVHKWPLWAEVGRRGAACAGIIGCRAHVSNFSHHLRDPKYGNVWHFPPERECSGANDEHQLCASPATRPSLTKADGNGSCAQRLWPAAAPPHEWFPDCTDVDDLSVPWPLRPCKFRSPSATEHPVRVRRGYGKPFLPDAAELEQLRRNTSAMREAKGAEGVDLGRRGVRISASSRPFQAEQPRFDHRPLLAVVQGQRY